MGWQAEVGLRERSGALARELQEAQAQRDALDTQLQVGLGCPGGLVGLPRVPLVWSPGGWVSLGCGLGSPGWVWDPQCAPHPIPGEFWESTGEFRAAQDAPDPIPGQFWGSSGRFGVLELP